MVLAAVTQLTSTSNILHNLSLTTSLLKRTASVGARVVFFPEATDFISANASAASKLTYSEENRRFLKEVRECARREGVWVGIGVHEPSERSELQGEQRNSTESTQPQRFYNTQLLIDDGGSIVSKYRKTHLFDVDIRGGLTIKESDSTVPGDKLEQPVDCPVGKLGVSVRACASTGT